MAVLPVKVAPGSRKDEIVGWTGDTLKIRVSAPPEKGRANRAVAALLARTLRIERDRIAIVAGAGSRRKLVRLEGLAPGEVRERISSGRRKRPSGRTP